MPLYWASVLMDGYSIGAAVVNRPTSKEASDAAYRLAKAQSCGQHDIEVMTVEIPVGSPPIPAEGIGKLLSPEECQRLFGDCVSVELDGDGKLREVAD